MRKRIFVIAVAAAVALTLLNLNFLARLNKDFLVGQAEQALERRFPWTGSR